MNVINCYHSVEMLGNECLLLTFLLSSVLGGNHFLSKCNLGTDFFVLICMIWSAHALQCYTRRQMVCLQYGDIELYFIDLRKNFSRNMHLVERPGRFPLWGTGVVMQGPLKQYGFWIAEVFLMLPRPSLAAVTLTLHISKYELFLWFWVAESL